MRQHGRGHGGLALTKPRLLRGYPPPCLPQPVPHGRPVGLTCDHVTGFPVLRLSSSSMHAVTNTPAESQAALSVLFTCDGGLPRINAGSASALPFSRPAQCSLTLRPACSPSPLQNPLHQRLQPLRYLHVCSGCYRSERKLPGGIRTRWKTAPWHGAPNSCSIRAEIRGKMSRLPTFCSRHGIVRQAARR